MNMISTGAFLNEMDASNKQPTAAERFAAVWEKKNAKAARAGGVSLMALSLAACGSSSSTTSTTSTDTTTTTTTTPAGAKFSLTTLADLAGETNASNGSLNSTFRFTDGDEVVNGASVSVTNSDALLDGSSTDNDTLNIDMVGTPASALTAVNIETLSLNYLSGSTPDFDMASMTGVKTVNVTGSVAGEISSPGAATVKITDFTRQIELDYDLSGTTTAGTAETANIEVSGATYGTTAATRTVLDMNSAVGNGTLETFNITSSGAAANVMALTKDSTTTFKDVNLLGDTAMTLRVEHNDITGVKVTGSGEGAKTVRINRESDGTTATNVANFSGVDLEIADDATTPAAAMVLASVASGQTITVLDDMASSSSISMTGATVASQAASLNLILDNATASADTDIGGDLSIQNTAALNLTSNGNATAATDAGSENALNIDGDFTTITITGDTSVDITAKIDGAGTAETTARTTVVDASGMTSTARLEFDTDGLKYVTYDVTGTANADTISVKGKITGGAGNDILSGHALTKDTILGGDGKDTITVTNGADVLTGGDGNDTYDIDSGAFGATAQVTISGDMDGTATAATSDKVIVRIDGTTYSHTSAGDLNAAIDGFVAEHAANILDTHGVTVIGNVTTATAFKLTGKADGTAFVADFFFQDGTAAAAEVTDATSGQVTGAAKWSATEITDFAAGDKLDVAGMVTSSTVVYHEGAESAVTGVTGGDPDDNVVVLTDAGYANIGAAEDAYDATAGNGHDGIVVFLNSTLGYAQVAYDDDMGVDGSLADVDILFNLTNLTTTADIAAAFSDTSIVL